MSRSVYFPSPLDSSAEGLVAVGGDLGPERLLDAYRNGIFPWPIYPDDPMLWWSPDPRAIIPLDGFHVSKRLQRTINSNRFQITQDQVFDEVVIGCATAQDRQAGTWITDKIVEAYSMMHRLGHAHSVEVWHDGKLAGGTYGIAIGGLFAAESMFYQVRDASKVALAHLVEYLNLRGYHLLDVQQWTAHTGTLGAIEIAREEYLRRLAIAIELPITFLES